MTEQRPSPRGDVDTDDVTLRLLWPQWQGAGTSSVQALAPESPFAVARRGYAVGSAVLAAVLPANQGPTAAAPVAMDDTGLELVDGIEAKQVILTQLPATVSPDRVALVGLHAWANDDIANVAQWGIRSFSPDDLREATQPAGGLARRDWLLPGRHPFRRRHHRQQRVRARPRR